MVVGLPPPSLPSSSPILKLAPIFRWKVNFWKITFPFGGQIWYFTLASKAQAEFRLEKEELRLSRRGKRGKTFEGINFLHALLSFHHQSSSSSSRVEVVFERLKLFCFRFPIVSSTATSGVCLLLKTAENWGHSKVWGGPRCFRGKLASEAAASIQVWKKLSYHIEQFYYCCSAVSSLTLMVVVEFFLGLKLFAAEELQPRQPRRPASLYPMKNMTSFLRGGCPKSWGCVHLIILLRGWGQRPQLPLITPFFFFFF